MTGTPKPHACVVLAIDPGATSGWAVLFPVRGQVIEWAEYGSERTSERRRYAVLRAGEIAQTDNLPLIVTAETWSAHGAFGGARTQRGLGEAWGRWAEQIEEAGIPDRRIVRVLSNTWQGKVVGVGGRATREQRIDASIEYVRRRFGVVCSADEAAAICIGVYGMHCDEVAAVLPKARAKKARRA